MILEHDESAEMSDAIKEGIDKLLVALNGVKTALEAQKPPVVNVAPSSAPAPQIRVDAPIIPPVPKQEPIVFPKPQAPVRWSFEILRDKEGKIMSLFANPLG